MLVKCSLLINLLENSDWLGSGPLSVAVSVPWRVPGPLRWDLTSDRSRRRIGSATLESQAGVVANQSLNSVNFFVNESYPNQSKRQTPDGACPCIPLIFKLFFPNVVIPVVSVSFHLPRANRSIFESRLSLII